MIINTLFSGEIRRTTHGKLLLVGQFLGATGDIFLLFRGDLAFKAGLGFFAAGHLGLVGAMLTCERSLSRLALGGIAGAAAAYGAFCWLEPQLLGEKQTLVPLVGAYAGMLALLLASSLGASRRSLCLPLAACLFFISDILVAQDSLIESNVMYQFGSLPLYYLAQALFTFALAVPTSRRWRGDQKTSAGRTDGSTAASPFD